MLNRLLLVHKDNANSCIWKSITDRLSLFGIRLDIFVGNHLESNKSSNVDDIAGAFEFHFVLCCITEDKLNKFVHTSKRSQSSVTSRWCTASSTYNETLPKHATIILMMSKYSFRWKYLLWTMTMAAFRGVLDRCRLRSIASWRKIVKEHSFNKSW